MAWVCTYRHDGEGNNDAYNFSYLCQYRLDLPPNASSLVLPNAPNIRILAMTLATNTSPETVPAGGPLRQNLLPWANAGPNQIVTAPATNGTATVVLNGSGSGDPDGAIVSYVWSQNGTSLATGVNPVVHLPIGANLIFLTVTDNQGETGIGEMSMVVLPPLIVSLSATPTNASGAPLTVQFSSQATGGIPAPTPYDTTDDHLGAVTAAGENNGLNGNWEVATNAFDDTTGTKWLDFANNHPSTRQSWIQYQYANGQRYVVTEYTITSANDAAIYPERNPADWRLLGSNNGGASWVTLDLRANQVFTANFQKLAYSFTNTTAYNLYRFQVDRVANPAQAAAMQLDELEFLLVPAPYSYFWSFGDGTTSTNQNPQHTYAANGTYTVTLVVSDGLSTATNTTTVYAAPPILTISQPGAGELTLSWPTWATGYTLYSTTNLAPPIVWSPVTNPVTIVGDLYVVTPPIDPTGHRFFRLQRSVNVVGNSR